MSNNKTARRDYIDIMKGLGILLVVLGHFMEQFRFGFKPIGATFICISVFTTFSFYTRNTIQLYL